MTSWQNTIAYLKMFDKSGGHPNILSYLKTLCVVMLESLTFMQSVNAFNSVALEKVIKGYGRCRGDLILSPLCHPIVTTYSLPFLLFHFWRWWGGGVGSATSPTIFQEWHPHPKPFLRTKFELYLRLNSQARIVVLLGDSTCTNLHIGNWCLLIK